MNTGTENQNTETLLGTLDPSQFTSNTMELIENQPTINIGMVGNANHGKSSLIHKMTGINPLKHESEKVRNTTIKLGYANAKIYKCPTCPRPGCYKPFPSSTREDPSHDVPGCQEKMKLIRHVSFVDCPGHDLLMATMLAGASVMDGAFLLVSANETCPQPQTSEHLAAVEIMNLNKVIVLQSKVDLIKHEEARSHASQIKSFLQGTIAHDSPVIPISAPQGFNLDVVCEYICNDIPTPLSDFTSPPLLSVVRSFDVNHPGTPFEKMKGGVAGGTLLRGILRLGDNVEIRPGLLEKDANGKIRCTPLTSQVRSLFSEKNELQFAAPGGLIGVGTTIDPILCKGDRLVGQMMGLNGKLPEVYLELEIEYYLVRRLLGVRSATNSKNPKVEKLAKSEILMLNIGSTVCGGKILNLKPNLAKISLLQPVCCQIKDKIALSRRINKTWRLIGWAEIRRGTTCKFEEAN